MRLAHLPVPKDFAENGKAEPTSFELSSEEKLDPLPRLSVFSESRSTARQAWEIVGSKEKQYLCLRLQVDAVRAFPPLDVVWHRIPVEKAGAAGHAGVTGLAGSQRKVLRTQLASRSDAHVLRCVPRGRGGGA